MKSLKKNNNNKPMKIFIIKSLFVFLCIFVLFKMTIGSLINKYEKKVDFYFSKEQSVHIKNKLRDELKSAINKDQYLDPEDAKLIRDFMIKLKNEINLQ